MRRIKIAYRRPPRQVHSHASVELRLPFDKLLEMYLPRFLKQTVAWLETGNRVPDVNQLLEVEQLDAVWRRWQDSDLAGPPPALSFAPRVSCLKDTAAALHDLASDDGAWSQEIRDGLIPILEAAQALIDRLPTALRMINDQQGPEGGRQLVEFFAGRLAEERSVLATKYERFQRTAWTLTRRTELRAAAERLREINATVSWPKRSLQRLAPKLARSLMLSTTSKYHLRKAVDLANAAYRDRHLAMADQVRLEVIDQLLGKNHQSGLLVRELARIHEDLTVVRSFAGQTPEPVLEKSDPTTIELVTDLDTIIDTKSGLTFGKHWDARLQSAGFSPEHFGQRVRAHGLVIDGRRYRVEEWNQIPAEERPLAMMAALRSYFGADDLDRTIRYDDSLFPIDHLAAVKLTDEALRTQIDKCLPKLKGLIASFAPCRPIAEANPREMVFLYCEKSQRAMWHELLGTQMKLSISEEIGSEPYDFDNPHVLVLLNATLGIPGGTLEGYQNWMATGNRARREHPEPPLFPRTDFKESRLIDERDNSHPYCEHLFDAALKCAAIFAVTKDAPERFALSVPNAQVDHHFTRIILVPSWESAEHFHGLIRNGSAFIVFVERQIKLGGFRHIADRLRRESDAESVAQTLEQLHVIERNRAGQCRVLCAHDGRLDGLTEQLYEAQEIQLVGLERPDFVAALQHDNELHNLLFWSVLDAFQLGELAQPDVPEFVLHHAHAVR
jgi:hypothetical protein